MSTLTDPAESDDAQRVDDALELLANRRRRQILQILREEQAVDLGTLAERIAAAECDKPVADLHSQERKRVYVASYQCHLPALEDFGAVETHGAGEGSRSGLEIRPGVQHATLCRAMDVLDAVLDDERVPRRQVAPPGESEAASLVPEVFADAEAHPNWALQRRAADYARRAELDHGVKWPPTVIAAAALYLAALLEAPELDRHEVCQAAGVAPEALEAAWREIAAAEDLPVDRLEAAEAETGWLARLREVIGR